MCARNGGCDASEFLQDLGACWGEDDLGTTWTTCVARTCLQVLPGKVQRSRGHDTPGAKPQV